MTTTSELRHNFFRRLQEEHAELVGMLGRVRDVLRFRRVDPVEIDHLITRLCNCLETHFAEEEEGGYLHDAAAHGPKSGAAADRLHHQHEALLEELVQLRLLASQAPATAAWWDELTKSFEGFCGRLITHEALEDDLVEEALRPHGTVERTPK